MAPNFEAMELNHLAPPEIIQKLYPNIVQHQGILF